MEHVYSKFRKKGNVNIPYAKVGNRVFCGLLDAETYCTQKNLNPDDWIEYGDSKELKDKIREIAQIQKPILRGVMDRMDAHIAEAKKEVEHCLATRKTCHPLDRGYWDTRITEAVAKLTEAYDAKKIVWDMMEDLQRLTGWKGGDL